MLRTTAIFRTNDFYNKIHIVKAWYLVPWPSVNSVETSRSKTVHMYSLKRRHNLEPKSRQTISRLRSHRTKSFSSLKNFFCRTSLPLASTGWVQITTFKLCSVHCTSMLLINVEATPRIFSNSRKNSREKFLGNDENRTRAAGCEARTLPLCQVA